MSKPSYIIYNEMLECTYNGIMESGVLYTFDNKNNKVALCDLWWDNLYHIDLCVISCAGRFGYADTQSGRIVHKPQWECALPFCNNITLVKADGKFGYIDCSGRYVVQPEWDKMSHSVYNGLILVCRNKKWGFVNEIGEIVIPPEWDMVEGKAFSHEMTTHWDITYDWPGVIKAHREVLPAAVLRDGKWGFIDMHGKVVVEPQFDTLFPHLWTFDSINRVIDPQFDTLFPPNRTVTKWFEDKTGEVGKTVTISAHEAYSSLFDEMLPIDDTTVRLTACPMYISLKRKSRWYRVQMGVDGKISVLKGKEPMKK